MMARPVSRAKPGLEGRPGPLKELAMSMPPLTDPVNPAPPPRKKRGVFRFLWDVLVQMSA
jgi:hypothetical protein